MIDWMKEHPWMTFWLTFFVILTIGDALNTLVRQFGGCQ